MTDCATTFLDVCMGDAHQFGADKESYEYTLSLLEKNASVYGLPLGPDELDDEQRGILCDIDNSGRTLNFTAPTPLLVGRLTIDLDSSAGLAKTRTNFIALCTGEKGSCKNAPGKQLHYLDCPIHRVVKGFIAQGGDVTRGDGRGGESIYGGKFNDEKAGLKIKPCFGSIGMANSGKNSNSSQFFIVLAEDEAAWNKLAGKYVFFGNVRMNDEGKMVLRRLDQVAKEGSDVPSTRVWIGASGRL